MNTKSTTSEKYNFPTDLIDGRIFPRKEASHTCSSVLHTVSLKALKE